MMGVVLYDFDMNEQTKEKIFYTSAEVAQIFGVSSQTILNWKENGRFPNAIMAGQRALFTVDDVNAVKQAEAQTAVNYLESMGYSVTLTSL